MTVKKGETVRITFVNKDGFHDFVLDEFGVKTEQIKGGTQEVVEFVADKAGTFEYYCSVGQHRQMGMKGTLTVTE
jgi:nitrosocyanin